MKTKLVLIASAAVFATSVYLHHKYQPPAGFKCPLAATLSAKK